MSGFAARPRFALVPRHRSEHRGMQVLRLHFVSLRMTAFGRVSFAGLADEQVDGFVWVADAEVFCK